MKRAQYRRGFCHVNRTASGYDSVLGMPNTPLSSADLEEVVGKLDTERPPPVPPLESTKIGHPPAPDFQSAGPPTPRGLRAAPPSQRGVPGAQASQGRPSVPKIAAAPAKVATQPGPRMGTSPGIDPNVPLTRRCTSCETQYPADFMICPRDATPLVDLAGPGEDPLVGRLIGETYQIVRLIGEGGMGRVYEARHLRLKERRFAVKTLHKELARNAEMAARFLREAESVSSLKHPNVIDVFDVHHLPDGTPYFVGEYLEGEELADYVDKRGALDPRTAIAVTRQVCSALAAAHARGIVHRDMKPENVFVQKTSPPLQVKVLDFGISKASGGTDQLTRTGVIMGTPSYMSPEQARGKSVDHRADVYSVGACLYYMLTARLPFDAEDPTSTISMVLTQDPKRPREIDAKIPESLELVVQRAMAKEPDERYSSMLDLDAALATVEAGLGERSQAMSVLSTPRNSFEVVKLAREHAQSTGNLARLARPTIIVTSSALGIWLVAGLVAALAGLVRMTHEGEVTMTESLLLTVGCLFGAATPGWLYLSHVRRRVWPNSVRALALATDLKRTAVAALVTYGVLTMTARVAYTVVLRTSKILVSGYWDLAIFLAAVIVAVASFWGPRVMQKLRRRS